MDAAGTFTGSFFTLLSRYALLAGELSLTVFFMHGALYRAVKTDGPLAEQMAKAASGTWVAVVLLFVLTMLATFFAAPFQFDQGLHRPLFRLFVVLVLAGVPVPTPGPFEHRPQCPQPDDLQLVVDAADADGDADHRVDRRADRTDLHGVDLLDVSGEDGNNRGKLLAVSFRVMTPQVPARLPRVCPLVVKVWPARRVAVRGCAPQAAASDAR